jgi:Flp pilus assembly protein TadG
MTLRIALRGQSGSSLVELALLTSLLLLMLAGAVDMGQAFYAAIEVSSAATAGAEYGMQNPTDVSGMQKAALLDGADLSGLAATATWGCECSDGTSASALCSSKPSCITNVVGYVQVTTSMTYVPMLGFPGVPSSLPLKGSARMRVGD